MTDPKVLTLSSSEAEEKYFLRQKLTLIFIFGFVSGVFVSSLYFTPPVVSVLAVFVSGAILLVEKIIRKRIGREVLMLSVLVASLSLGAFRYSVKDFHTPNAELESLVGETIELEGLVVGETEIKESSERFILRTADGEEITVSASLYSGAVYGDEVRVEGKLGKPGLIDDGLGRPFDYATYLSKDDIYYTLSFAQVEVALSGQGHPLKHALFGIKRRFVERVRSILPEPESSLLAGLVVAGKDSMPDGILEEFRRAGVIHIVVLSGYNIAIIADFMRRGFEALLLSLRWGVSPRLAAGASIVGVLLFVIMTGAEATVVRASIMVLAVIAAKMFGRAYSAPRALVGAAFLMIIHNPKILVFDPSFQLSFLATSALIYIVPIVERYMSWIPAKAGLRAVVSTTIGTQVAVLPLLVWSVGDVSLVSLPANILTLLIIPATMLVGFLAALVSFISPWIALPLSYAAHLLLSWILGVSHLLGNISFASVSVPVFPTWALVLSYVALAALIWRFGSSSRNFAN